ncbi:hypothetical protein [Sphingopyxis bauzanensis]|uniref:hypothetical protein n=1 Tax=Sphingopyxis bauzanensis TaxID=651663 RepID=UPI00130349A8|nr:hypothetical protein [Sphingopyxis bauzanensis]GGJ39071.1 hypothetical protein GCM10011393_06660 [Sphingopyxis bauzanensis]
MLLSLLLPACSPSPLAVKRLLKKPPRKPRPLKLLLKKAPTPLLLAPTPLPLVPKLLPLVPKLLLRPTLLRPLLLRLTPLLLRLKKLSKSQPFGALTETRNGRSSFGTAAFFFAFCTGGIDLRHSPV